MILASYPVIADSLGLPLRFGPQVGNVFGSRERLWKEFRREGFGKVAAARHPDKRAFRDAVYLHGRD